MSSVNKRPLSPHLSIYRMQYTMVMSGLHRITGLGLTLGSLLFAWWIIAAAAGEPYFDTIQNFLGSWFGILVLLGFSFSLFYHMCNGIRHLLWDVGVAIDIEGIKKGGLVMLFCAVVLTLSSWGLAFLALS